MTLALDLGGHPLVLRAHCVGARGDARTTAYGWSVRLDGGEGVGVFLLDDADSDGAFLERLDGEPGWAVTFYDAEAQQVELVSTDGTTTVLLHLEVPTTGAPVEAHGGAAEDDPDAAESGPSPALWVTVEQRE